MVGPIDSVDVKAGTLKILGQTFRADAKKAAAIAANLSGGAQPVVSVLGAPKNDGSLAATTMLVFESSYVPGATKVLLTGKVSSVNHADAKLTIGKQVVDYSSLLAKANVAISVGALVTVIGSQPVSLGEVLAETVK